MPGLHRWSPIVVEDAGPQLIVHSSSAQSIDYPLRSQKTSRTILVSPYVDWCEKFIPPRIKGLILATMCLSTWNTFVTVTKDYLGLFKLLTALDDTGDNRSIPVPADKPFTDAILRANVVKGSYNLTNRVQIRADERRAVNPPKYTLTPFQARCEVPWTPHNVIFGLSVANISQAELATVYGYDLRKRFPGIKIAIHQPESADEINWGLVTNAGVFDHVWEKGNIDVNLVRTGALV